MENVTFINVSADIAQQVTAEGIKNASAARKAAADQVKAADGNIWAFCAILHANPLKRADVTQQAAKLNDKGRAQGVAAVLGEQAAKYWATLNSAKALGVESPAARNDDGSFTVMGRDAFAKAAKAAKDAAALADAQQADAAFLKELQAADPAAYDAEIKEREAKANEPAPTPEAQLEELQALRAFKAAVLVMLTAKQKEKLGIAQQA